MEKQRANVHTHPHTPMTMQCKAGDKEKKNFKTFGEI